MKRCWWVFPWIGWGMIGPAIAQVPPAPTDGPTVAVTRADESGFPLMAIDFLVKRPDGSFVLDARAEDFRVGEDGRDRPILGFDAPVSVESRPTTLVLVVDHSGSMKQDDRIGALKQAVATFMDGVPRGSRVAVVGFSGEVEVLCDFTTDRGRVTKAVEALEAEGGTRYYDAVARALGMLADQPGRRAVLALTDGKDTLSQGATLKSAVELARRLKLPVHTLGLGDEREIAVDTLRELAEMTRGQAYLARDVDQLKGIYEEIARRLGSSYTLTYATDRKVPDGTLRPIRITYRRGAVSGEKSVFIRGIVVPQAGWSGLFLALLLALAVLARLPSFLGRRGRKTTATPASIPPTHAGT